MALVQRQADNEVNQYEIYTLVLNPETKVWVGVNFGFIFHFQIDKIDENNSNDFIGRVRKEFYDAYGTWTVVTFECKFSKIDFIE